LILIVFLGRNPAALEIKRKIELIDAVGATRISAARKRSSGKKNFEKFLIEGSTAPGFFSLMRVALEFARGFARQLLAGFLPARLFHYVEIATNHSGVGSADRVPNYARRLPARARPTQNPVRAARVPRAPQGRQQQDLR